MAKKDETDKCCLCGRGDSPSRPLLTGRNGAVCSDCIQQAYTLCKDAGFISENSKKSKNTTVTVKEVAETVQETADAVKKTANTIKSLQKIFR